MIHDVVDASYHGGYQIEVTFDDGAHGIVDFSAYLERAGVFERFRDINYFRNFEINAELGTLTWPDGVDVAPETLYAQATGTPLPAWMISEDVFVS
jgi:hypothetical protein